MNNECINGSKFISFYNIFNIFLVFNWNIGIYLQMHTYGYKINKVIWAIEEKLIQTNRITDG